MGHKDTDIVEAALIQWQINAVLHYAKKARKSEELQQQRRNVSSYIDELVSTLVDDNE